MRYKPQPAIAADPETESVIPVWVDEVTLVNLRHVNHAAQRRGASGISGQVGALLGAKGWSAPSHVGLLHGAFPQPAAGGQ